MKNSVLKSLQDTTPTPGIMEEVRVTSVPYGDDTLETNTSSEALDIAKDNFTSLRQVAEGLETIREYMASKGVSSFEINYRGMRVCYYHTSSSFIYTIKNIGGNLEI